MIPNIIGISSVYSATLCISFVGCSTHGPGYAPNLNFTGVWKETFAEAGSQFTKEVMVDGRRFKIVERDADPFSGSGPKLRVFDGHRFLEKNDWDPGFPDKGSIRASAEQEVSYLRFWVWTPQSQGTPGQPLLGRETMLYESKEPLTDTFFRRWVDKETGILLKEEQIRSQTNTLKFTRECQRLSFGDVDQSAFAIP